MTQQSATSESASVVSTPAEDAPPATPPTPSKASAAAAAPAATPAEAPESEPSVPTESVEPTYTRAEILDAYESYGVSRPVLAAALHLLGRPGDATRPDVEAAIVRLESEPI